LEAPQGGSEAVKIEIFTTFTYPGNVLRIGFEQFGPIREGAMYERITKEISNTSLSDTGMLEQIFGRAAELQHQAIALRAHQVFLERGGAHGRDLQDWLAAKRELFGPH